MDASVVIPTKNGGDRFIDVLATVVGQITSYEYEIVCVDSGSSDSTVEVIKAFPEAKLLQIPPEEFGHGKTRSWAAHRCSGDYVIFITQDALPVDLFWLQNFIDAMKATPDAVAGFGAHKPYPECNLFDARDISAHFERYGPDNDVIQVDDMERFNQDLPLRMYYAFFSDNNACVRRDYFLENPYPDVNFAEDQFWMMEQMGKGAKKVYCPKAAVYHSHNYGTLELMQRAFDESRALNRLFGWNAVPNGRKIPRMAAGATRRDWGYIRTLDLTPPQKLRALGQSATRNASKLLGSHEGAVYDAVSPERQRRMDKWLSQLRRQMKK